MQKFNFIDHGTKMMKYHLFYLMGTISILHASQSELSNGVGDTPLHKAVRSNDIATVQALIEQGADINARNQFGDTPLHVAPQYGNTQIVDALIKEGADINAKNQNGITPLHRAVIYEQPTIAKLLIDQKADVDAQNEFGDTPLHIAVNRGLINLIKILVQGNANTTIKNDDQKTPVDLIRSKVIDIGYLTNNPLTWAIIENNEEEFDKLVGIKNYRDMPDHDLNTPLHKAIDWERLDMANALIEHSVTIDAQNKFDNTPLHRAVRKNMTSIIKTLIQRGADPAIKTKSKKSAFELAAPEIKDILLSYSLENLANNLQALLAVL